MPIQRTLPKNLVEISERMVGGGKPVVIILSYITYLTAHRKIHHNEKFDEKHRSLKADWWNGSKT